MHAAGLQSTLLPHVPFAPQVCWVSLSVRHWFAPGAHAAHWPAKQNPESQVPLLTQLPEASHVRFPVVPTHSVAPGLHAEHVVPMHVPEAQLWLTQWPLVQVCAAVPSLLHCLLPVEHSTHVLPSQMGGVHTVVSAQLPPVWHVCTLLLKQRLSFGVHTPVQLPPAQVNVHGASPPQLPAASQVCATFGASGLQRAAPGTHDPVHVELVGEQT